MNNISISRAFYKLIDRPKFTLKEYERFLQTISKYRILPLNEFRNYHNENEVVIGLRHDIDDKLSSAFHMSSLEFDYGIRSTYFFLHTAKYFQNTDVMFNNMEFMEEHGSEVGLHMDIMSLKQSRYVIMYSNERAYQRIMLRSILQQLRKVGITIYGTSAHGDKEHKNIHFWEHYNKADFGILYEAYELDHNLYFSDCTFINGRRWNPNDLPELKAGDRCQILIHPQHYTN